MAGHVERRCAERAVCRVRRVDGHGEGSRENVELGPEAAVSAEGVVSGQQAPPGEVPGSSPAFLDVWAQVTSGEHYFAPRPIEAAQPPEIQEAWKARRNNILHLIRRDRPSPHYTNLRTELNTLATSLARSIDSLTDSPILSPAPDRSPRRAIA